MKVAVVTLIAAAVLGGCSATGAAPSPAPVELTIFAAASLGRALGQATAAYEASRPGIAVTVSTGSSTALRTQIEQGAPADLLLSADTANPRALVADGLASGSPVGFARNLLTVVVPAANPAGIRTPADLARTGVRVVAAGDAVPITKYATQVVAALAAQPGYPADFAARYAANVVSREDDVAAVLAKIALGEGDAAIVYVTDASGASGVTAVPIPAAANVPATYAGVVVGGSHHVPEARAFLEWLAGPPGRAVLGRFGFLPPS